MKKYTKRLLAFLLALAMVVTGVPMSAKEAKAAEGDFVLDFGYPTNGVVSPVDGSISSVIILRNVDLPAPFAPITP